MWTKLKSISSVSRCFSDVPLPGTYKSPRAWKAPSQEALASFLASISVVMDILAYQLPISCTTCYGAAGVPEFICTFPQCILQLFVAVSSLIAMRCSSY